MFSAASLAIGTGSGASLLDELTSLLRPGDPDLPHEFEILLRQGLDDVLPELGDSGPARPEREPLPDKGLQEAPGAKHLFLTFDDGPLYCTGHILDHLAATNHKATFFVIGANLKNPKLREYAVRALKEGHDLGNHSWSHPDFSHISVKRAKMEIESTHALINEVVKEAGITGENQNLFFRFPYGVEGSWSNSKATRDTLATLGYSIARWDLDTNDWRMELAWAPRSSRRVVDSLKHARPQDVVLLHDRTKTASCLPAIMGVLESFKLVSLPLSQYESVQQES